MPRELPVTRATGLVWEFWSTGMVVSMPGMQVKELGHIVLYVEDQERSRRFYRDLLGWPEVAAFGSKGAVFSSGRSHHELLLIEVGPGAQPVPEGRRLGMYHFGLKIGET